MQSHSGAFPTPSRGDPYHEIKDQSFFFIYIRSGNQVPPHLQRCSCTKKPHSKSDLCTGINQQIPPSCPVVVENGYRRTKCSTTERGFRLSDLRLAVPNTRTGYRGVLLRSNVFPGKHAPPQRSNYRPDHYRRSRRIHPPHFRGRVFLGHSRE